MGRVGSYAATPASLPSYGGSQWSAGRWSSLSPEPLFRSAPEREDISRVGSADDEPDEPGKLPNSIGRTTGKGSPLGPGVILTSDYYLPYLTWNKALAPQLAPRAAQIIDDPQACGVAMRQSSGVPVLIISDSKMNR